MTDSTIDVAHPQGMSHAGHFYFHIIGNMNNTDAIAAFLALGQETRLNVFRLIVQRGKDGLTPSALIEQLAIPQATLSFHLKELLRAQLLLVERQGRQLIYRPNAVLVENLSDFLLENCCGGQSCSPRTPSKTLSTP
jgi:ArsR family transcriptional regulator